MTKAIKILKIAGEQFNEKSIQYEQLSDDIVECSEVSQKTLMSIFVSPWTVKNPRIKKPWNTFLTKLALIICMELRQIIEFYI